MRGRIFIVTIIVLAMSACSSSNICYEDMSTTFRITMHRQVFDTEKEKYVEQDYQSTATIHGMDVDSLLYNQVTASQYGLPLKKLDSLSVFLIEQRKIEEGDTLYIEDTLWVKHANSLEFVSLECGCASIFDVTEVRHTVNMIDSVKLVEKHVDRSKVNNLKIYVRK